MTGLKCIVKKRETGHTEMYPCFSACSYSVQLSDLAGQSPSVVGAAVGVVWSYRVCLKLGQQLESVAVYKVRLQLEQFGRIESVCSWNRSWTVRKQSWRKKSAGHFLKSGVIADCETGF